MIQNSNEISKQLLYQRSFSDKEIILQKNENIDPSIPIEIAWQKLKHPVDGFERFALRKITKNYIASRKPFQLATVMRDCVFEWNQLDQTMKYYFSKF